MAKPRIFVSSTYYDLKHIRTSLESFINSFGYEPVLFESGDIFFSHDKPLDESCYNELKNCHMQILIIGGSYGSSESSVNLTEQEKKDQYHKFNSITKKEFEVANERKIPIYFFVENGVLSEYSTYKKNRNNKNINYAHVSSVNIFTLLDDIYSLHNGNYIKGFSKAEDISEWLKSQWAHLLAEFISNKAEQIELAKIKNSVDELNNVTNSLKSYTEAFLNISNPIEFAKVKTEEEILQTTRIRKRFYENRLIEFVERGRTQNSEKTYTDFNESNNLKDFINKTINKIKDENIKNRLLSIVNDTDALSDYNILKDFVNRKIDTEEYLDRIANIRVPKRANIIRNQENTE